MSNNGCMDTSLPQIINVVDIPNSLFQTVDTICLNDPPLYVDTVIGNQSNGYIDSLYYVWEIIDSSGAVIWSDSLNNNTIPVFPNIESISSLLDSPNLFDTIGYLDYYIRLTVSNCCGSNSILTQ